jgi:hypothetical protein
VLEFYAIESPLAQPRNAVLGQVLSSIVGVAISKLFALAPATATHHALTWTAGALACACSVAIMALTGTVHPPAGATALLAVVDDGVRELGWYLIPVVLLGCGLMQAVALLFNNIQRRFPVYWWTPEEVGQRWKRERKEKDEEKGVPISENLPGGEHHDIDGESTARITLVASQHADGAASQHQNKIVITNGQVLLPEGLHIMPEEKLLLEELSERL